MPVKRTALLPKMLWLLLLLLATPPRVQSSVAMTARSASGRAQAAKPYDKDPSRFSPDGELLQVAYADQAGENGTPVVCLATSERSIVLVWPASGRTARLLDRRCVDKLARVDDGIWLVTAGLLGDARQVVRLVRRYCVNYRTRFGTRPSVRNVAHQVGLMQHEASLVGGKRPLGVHVLTCGFEGEAGAGAGAGRGPVPAVYVSRASGDVVRWRAVAIGKGSGKLLRLLEEDDAGSSSSGSSSSSSSGSDGAEAGLPAEEVATQRAVGVLQRATAAWRFVDGAGADGGEGEGTPDAATVAASAAAGAADAGGEEARFDVYVLRAAVAADQQAEVGVDTGADYSATFRRL